MSLSDKAQGQVVAQSDSVASPNLDEIIKQYEVTINLHLGLRAIQQRNDVGIFTYHPPEGQTEGYADHVFTNGSYALAVMISENGKMSMAVSYNGPGDQELGKRVSELYQLSIEGKGGKALAPFIQGTTVAVLENYKAKLKMDQADMSTCRYVGKLKLLKKAA